MIVEELNDEDWEAVEQERAELEEAEVDVADRQARWRSYYSRLHEWETRRQDLALEGRDPPPAPQEPDVVEPPDDANHRLLQRRQALREQEKQVKARLRPAVEERAAELEADLAERARPVAEQLHQLVQEYDQLLTELRDVRSASDSADPDRQPAPEFRAARRTRERVTVADLVDAVQQGESLLELAPAQPQQREDAIVAGDVVDPTAGTGATVRGMTPTAPFGQQPALGPTDRGPAIP